VGSKANVIERLLVWKMMRRHRRSCEGTGDWTCIN